MGGYKTGNNLKKSIKVVKAVMQQQETKNESSSNDRMYTVYVKQHPGVMWTHNPCNTMKNNSIN
jgi:hypothetical protein